MRRQWRDRPFLIEVDLGRFFLVQEHWHYTKVSGAIPPGVRLRLQDASSIRRILMKGFPNQVAELPTLTKAVGVMGSLIADGKDARDDGVFGEALIQRQVLGTGHTPIPIEEYLAAQKAIPKKGNQSYRTRARGLRELFDLLGLIHDDGVSIALTPIGRQIAALGENATSEAGLRTWRSVILQMTHYEEDGEASHPYQVLLRLVGKRPGITRAKCALALEARNDSDEELNRIAALATKSESDIRFEIGATESNWDNAKKILPRFAEQLGDVIKSGQSFTLADAPGTADEEPAASTPSARGTPTSRAGAPRRPRSSSSVTATTIAKSGTTEGWDEAAATDQQDLDPQALQEQKRKLKERLHRHNVIVQQIARILEAEGAELFEHPFDCLASFPDEGLLIEVKSLDGTEADEQERVREALAQLLYYDAFVNEPLVDGRSVKKIACFERQISAPHIRWMRGMDIHVIWREGDGFDGTDETKEALSGHFGF